jgi:DNA phosphorothioation-dependent restriction protein DptH
MRPGAERQRRLQTLRTLLAVDSVHVILTDFRGKHREAVLVSPTHPLRALWLRGWVALGDDWVGKIERGGRQHISHVRAALLDGLGSFGFPALPCRWRMGASSRRSII